jgi:dolichyl-phosphate-mannose--protein O-mannosyl transferase
MVGKRTSEDEEFLASLADGSRYSMGAYFSDQHPELVDEVIAQAEGIEQRGLRTYAKDAGMSVEEAYETLMTGLAVRYYNAVAG